jgi:hypothetical protein
VECGTDLDIRSLQIRPHRLRFTFVPLLHGEACKLYNFGLYCFHFSFDHCLFTFPTSFILTLLRWYHTLRVIAPIATYCSHSRIVDFVCCEDSIQASARQGFLYSHCYVVKCIITMINRQPPAHTNIVALLTLRC